MDRPSAESWLTILKNETVAFLIGLIILGVTTVMVNMVWAIVKAAKPCALG